MLAKTVRQSNALPNALPNALWLDAVADFSSSTGVTSVCVELKFRSFPRFRLTPSVPLPRVMGSDPRSHHIATISVTPLSPTATAPSMPPAIRAEESLLQWMRVHGFGQPPPKHHSSPAARALFTLVSRKPYHLLFNLHPTLPTITATIRFFMPTSVPALLHPGSESLRLIMWHVTRFKHPASLPMAPCGFACDSSCASAADKKSFHLSHVFRATTSPAPPPKRPRRPSCMLLNLPDDVLLKVVFLLNPVDYGTLSETHPYLRDFLLQIVPGLRLRLFPHQQHALLRMAEMERPRRHSFPLLEELKGSELPTGHALADLVDGSLMLLEETPRVQLPMGGLFCDEPGLGKTITALSLVLRTAGHTPRPPKGLSTSVVVAPCGRNVIAYEDDHIGRFEMYGNTTTNYPSRKSRLLPGLVSQKKRRSSRPVQVPNFFAASKGRGAVPVVAGKREIFLSRGTLIVVPPVLVPHWQTQIDQHIHTGIVKVLYIESRQDLPDDAIELATYDIILVSFDLLGELYAELRDGAPLLLQVHFVRVIVDEGHKLSSTSVTKLASVCDRIRADARWVMTGTPTPSTPRSDIDYLHSLLTFIHDEAYGLDKSAWRVGIRDPYTSYKRESLERLSQLLSRIMIRADKSILKAKCHVRNVLLEFSQETADSYNGLVRMARRNLVTSDWFDPKHKESLLNVQNWKQAQAVMANLRKACCFGGTMDVAFDRDDIMDTLDLLYKNSRLKAGIHENDRFRDPLMEMHLLEYDFGEDEIEQKRREDIQRRAGIYRSLDCPPLRLSKDLSAGKPSEVRKFQRIAYTGKLQEIGQAFVNCESVCAKCETPTKYPLVTPCGHLLCDKCVTLNKVACTVNGCGMKYILDKKGIPEDLIELQPSVLSTRWRDDWADTKSSKMSYLIQRIESLPLREEWKCNESCPRLIPPKVIVHSEYGDHLKLVALHMKGSSKLCKAYVEMVINTRDIHQDTRRIRKASQYAAHSVKKFAEDPGTQVLLMNTKHGAVGLDLSFVQYIFLLEPLWDSSNELQVISRAHRIGCKDDIIVERLIMKGSVEQDMLGDLQKSVNRLDESKLIGLAQAKAEKDHRKVTSLLRNLKVVQCEESVTENGHDVVIDEDPMDCNTDDTENRETGNSCDSVPSLDGESLSAVPSLSGHIEQRGSLKRRRSERESSAEPRRVRFRD